MDILPWGYLELACGPLAVLLLRNLFQKLSLMGGIFEKMSLME